MSGADRARALYPVLAHELKSPIAAILGYQELLEEGTFGELDPRAIDALHRVRLAALQLNTLIEGLEMYGDVAADSTDPVETIAAARLIDSVVETLRFDAEARGITLRTEPGDVVLRTRITDAARALDLALGAAIKASPGLTLTISAGTAPVPAIVIAGATLRADRDGPRADGAAPTGTGLRVSFADAAARRVGGRVMIDAAAAHDGAPARGAWTAGLRIELPSLAD